jgi:hypothetical protein
LGLSGNGDIEQVANASNPGARGEEQVLYLAVLPAAADPAISSSRYASFRCS